MDTVLHDATVFEDEFDGDWLSPEWFWVREDDMNWSLEDRPDFLRIYTQEGTLNSNEALPNNLLLRAAIRADYEVIVRFEGAFAENFQEAILALYGDDDNYLVVSRLYDDMNYGGDGYRFGREENGELVEPVFSAEAGETDTALRLVVSDRFVMGFYRNGAGEWVALGQLAVNGVDLYPFVGIGAYQGVGETAVLPTVVDFDYVVGRPIEVGITYIPFIKSPPGMQSLGYVEASGEPG
jgi:hypothetical protein